MAIRWKSLKKKGVADPHFPVLAVKVLYSNRVSYLRHEAGNARASFNGHRCATAAPSNVRKMRLIHLKLSGNAAECRILCLNANQPGFCTMFC
jgi:hypothetical protein